MEKENILNEESIKEDLRYLQLLAQSYPTIADASTEIINLEAILNLPKPTEHFISDPHGESDAFNHVLRNASGYVKRKVEEIFGTALRKAEKKELCTLIYYPEQKLQLIKATEQNLNDFYVTTLNQLIKVCREVSSKYTRSKIRKELPKEFGYIIEELLHESYSAYGEKKHEYYNVIMQSIINTQRADEFIIEICKLIHTITSTSFGATTTSNGLALQQATEHASAMCFASPCDMAICQPWRMATASTSFRLPPSPWRCIRMTHASCSK